MAFKKRSCNGELMRRIAFASILSSFLVASSACASQREVDRETARLQAANRAPLTAQEIAQLRARGWRDRRTGEIRPLVGSTFRPDDYVNATHRGTVEYDPSWSNYSFHTVQVPDGTVIDCGDRGCNFTQIAPLTDAFDRSQGFGHTLTLRDRMNLVNVMLYPDWTVECNCNTAQI